MDTRGQGSTLPYLAFLNALGLMIFLLSDQHVALQCIGVVIAGAAQPALGSVVRARWAVTLENRPEHKRAAFAWESILDELIFTIGPIFTAVIAVQLGLAIPLLLAAVFTVTGSLFLAVQRKTEPHKHPVGTPRGNVFHHRNMWRMPIIGGCFGWLFGSYEVTTVAFAENAGHPEFSGVILGLWAACSGIGGLWFGHRAWGAPLQKQLVYCTGILTIAILPAVFVRSIPALMISGIFAGAAIAPGLITTYALTERLVPSTLLTEALTWTNSGMILGYAAGTALSGFFIDARGTTLSYLLPPLGALIAMLVALGATPTATPSPEHD
jgi:predicted MFS family arabinose efflux permease